MALLEDTDNSACHKLTLSCCEEKIWCVNINTHYLYQLVREENYMHYDPRNAERIVKQILNDHKIPHELVDVNAASNPLISKIKYMFRQVRKCKGGSGKKKLLHRWTGETYRLKIGNLKQEFEFDIQRKHQDGSWFVNVNTHSLFNSVREGDLNYHAHDPRNAERVLKQILTDHNIPHELVDVNAAAKRLICKIKYMFRQLRKCKGGSGRKKLLHRWTGETYRLKIGDSTGRFESELEDQRKRREIEEEKFVKECQWSTLVQMERHGQADADAYSDEDTPVFGRVQVKMEPQEDYDYEDYDENATMITGGIQVKIEQQDDDYDGEDNVDSVAMMPGGVQVMMEQQEDDVDGEDDVEDATIIDVTIKIEPMDEVSETGW